jgi:hypothetical protein
MKLMCPVQKPVIFGLKLLIAMMIKALVNCLLIALCKSYCALLCLMWFKYSISFQHLFQALKELHSLPVNSGNFFDQGFGFGIFHLFIFHLLVAIHA